MAVRLQELRDGQQAQKTGGSKSSGGVYENSKVEALLQSTQYRHRVKYQLALKRRKSSVGESIVRPKSELGHKNGSTNTSQL